MPTYVYKCPSCEHEEVKCRKIDNRNDPCLCSQCGAECTRLIQAHIQKFGNQQGVSDWERIKNRHT